MNKKKIGIILVILFVLAILFGIIAFTGTGIGKEITSYLIYKIMVPKQVISFEGPEHITITYNYQWQEEKLDMDVTDKELIQMIKDSINHKKLENYSGQIPLAIMETYTVKIDDTTSFAFDYASNDGYVMMHSKEKQFLTKINPEILSKVVAMMDEKLTQNIAMFQTEKITITNKEGKQIEIDRKTAIDYLLERCKKITSKEIVNELNIATPGYRIKVNNEVEIFNYKVTPDYQIKFNNQVEIFKYKKTGKGFLLKDGILYEAYGLEEWDTFLENAFDHLEEKEKMFTTDKITITSKEKSIEITDQTVIEKITTPIIFSSIKEKDWLQTYDIQEEYENGIKIKINDYEFLIPGKVDGITIGNRYVISEDKTIKLCFPLQEIENYVKELLGMKIEKTTGIVSIAI